MGKRHAVEDGVTDHVIQDSANTELLAASESLRYGQQVILELLKRSCDGVACTGHNAFHLSNVSLEEYGKADSVCIISAFDSSNSKQRVDDRLQGGLINFQGSGDLCA